MDDSTLLCPSLLWAGRGRAATPSTGDHRPPPPIQGGRTHFKMLSCATHLCYLPRAMHAAYVAEDKGAVGRVNWQFLPHALNSFTGHY